VEDASESNGCRGVRCGMSPAELKAVGGARPRSLENRSSSVTFDSIRMWMDSTDGLVVGRFEPRHTFRTQDSVVQGGPGRKESCFVARDPDAEHTAGKANPKTEMRKRLLCGVKFFRPKVPKDSRSPHER
jgi:hypothetical protein